jgi:hypothetical protein
MLSLKRMAEAMRMSADAFEDHYKKTKSVPSPEKAKLIKELRELVRQILTSQEYSNSKIKL